MKKDRGRREIKIEIKIKSLTKVQCRKWITVPMNKSK